MALAEDDGRSKAEIKEADAHARAIIAAKMGNVQVERWLSPIYLHGSSHVSRNSRGAVRKKMSISYVLSTEYKRKPYRCGADILQISGRGIEGCYQHLLRNN